MMTTLIIVGIFAIIGIYAIVVETEHEQEQR